MGLFGKLDMPKESKRRVKERLRPYVKVNFFLSFSNPFSFPLVKGGARPNNF